MYNLKFTIKKFRKVLLLIVFVNFTFYILHSSALAQTYSLAIWPPLLEVMIKPGKSITQPYKLTNNGDDQTLIARVLPFEPSDSEGNINLLQLPSLLNPLSFSLEGTGTSLGKPFLIKSGETKDLYLKINVPPKAPEKDYFISLVFETTPEGRIGVSETQAAAKIASNLLITTSLTGVPLKKGRLAEFSCPKIVDSFDMVPFTLKIENLGQSFFKPFGKITIEGLFNQRGEVKILEKNVLPQFTRDLQVLPWKEKFILGPFRAKVEFTVDPPGSGGDTISQEITFLALPYKGVLALIIIVLVLTTISDLPKKKLSKKQGSN